MRKLISTVVSVAAIALLMGSINPEEYECEEAVAHLQDCCGPNAPVLNNIECGGTCSHVNLDEQTAICMRKASCDNLKKSGVCDANPTGLACQ